MPKKQDLQALYHTKYLDKVKACELALRRTRKFDPDIRMNRINKLLGGCGVEALRGEWSNGYWGDVVATYINFGDSYDTTIICLCTGASRWDCRFFISCYGDFVERYGERFGIQ